jgi:hypothetical protein
MKCATLNDLLPLRILLSQQTERLNSYALVFSDGTVKKFLRRICYAELNTCKKYKKPIKYFLDYPFATRKHTPFTKAEIAWVRWLVRRSPWRKAFASKSVVSTLKYGGVYRTSLPARYVMQAAVLLRHMVDYPHVIQCWYEFKRYCDPTVAMCIACFFRKEKGYFFCQRTWGSNHSIANTPLTVELVRNIVAGKLDKTQPLFANNTYFMHLISVWEAGTTPVSYPPDLPTREAGTWSRGKVVSFSSHQVEEVVNKFLAHNRLEQYGGRSYAEERIHRRTKSLND